jgi:hypothetical protein
MFDGPSLRIRYLKGGKYLGERANCRGLAQWEYFYHATAEIFLRIIASGPYISGLKTAQSSLDQDNIRVNKVRERFLKMYLPITQLHCM